MTVQDTAHAILKQWGEANGASPDMADKMMAALYSEHFTEAAEEIAAIPLPAAVQAAGGFVALATRRAFNDASKKLKQLAAKASPTCPPGTHGPFIPCPGTCTLPEVDG